MPRAGVSTGAIWTLYLIVLMDMLNFGIVFPLLPAIAEEFHANAMQVGSLATFFSVAQVMFTPILGWASDKFGRRPVLLIAIAGTTASTVLTGCAWNFGIMCAARAINGASGGTVGIANAYIADVCYTDEKATYISYLQACNSIGIIVGPALGGALAHYGFQLPCYVSAALSGLNLLIALIFLKEPGHDRREIAENLTHPLPEEGAVEGTTGAGVQENAARVSGNARLAARTASVDTGVDYIPCSAGLLFAAGFLFMLGFASFESVTGYYLLDTLFTGKGYANPTESSGQFYGLLFTLAGIGMLLVALFVYKPLLRFIGEFPTVALGGVLRCAGFMFMSLAMTPVQFAAAAVCQVVGGNLIAPTTSSLLTTICSKKIYGKALGLQQSFQAVARIFAPTIFGYLYDHFDHRLTFWINAGTTVIAVPLILMVPRPAQTMPVQEVEENITCLERQKSVPGVPPTLDGGGLQPTLRRQVSGCASADGTPSGGTPTGRTQRLESQVSQSLQRVEEFQDGQA